jgi:cyclopropane fatty-acyl-phospholipid synthase-like methyltransferase
MRPFVLVLSMLCLVACAPKRVEEAHAHGHAGHRFEHAEEWAARFEDPARDAWQKPDEVIAALGLPADAKLADVGSATGYFSVRFARALPQGTVYGVDVESSMVDYLKQRAETENLKNLSVVLGAFDDAKIPEPVDCILIVNTIHHIGERPAYFTKLAASLKPNGRIAVIDFKKGSKRGPPDADKLTVEQVAAELQQAGLALQSSWPFLPDQYFVTFGRAAK